MAIWHISDGLDISECTPSQNAADVKARAESIIADAEANAGTIQPFKTLVINIPNQSFTIGEPIQFTVEAYNEVGAPIPGAQVSISVDDGTLSQITATTGIDGSTETITLTAGSNNFATISASADVVIPGGTEYYHVSDPDGKQKLIIAAPFTDHKEITACVNWSNPVSLVVSKSTETVTVKDGDVVNYELKVENTGDVTATGVKVSDVLPAVLQFISSNGDGDYDPTTGIWNVGTVEVNTTKTLNISVKASFTAQGAAILDLGLAADYNLFVLHNINQPSSDTEGKMAVANNAELSNYSVGDKLASNSGDVLIVGRKLTYTSGRVYGDVAFGNFIDTTHWNLADGTIRQDSPIDFTTASLYLNNLSSQISALEPNGNVTFEYGHVALSGTNPDVNRFNVDGNLITQCNDFSIDVPENSVVIVNVSGKKITWKGGFELYGVTNSNVIINFYEAKKLNISQIGISASILAPKASLDFATGLISGQVIAYNVTGSGQFNNVPFCGKISLEMTISNFAELVSVDQPTTDAVVGKSLAQVNSLVSLTDVAKESNSSLPLKMDLMQNYPNPFNPSTKINFAIAKEGNYSLTVYNLLGEQIAVLANREFSPGNYSFNFDASKLNSGIYLYQLKGSSINITKKMMLIK